MTLKKILFISLIFMSLSLTAVSATNLKDINATDSIEPIQPVEPIKIIENSKAIDHDTNLEHISKNKTDELLDTKNTPTSPGTFDELQKEIDKAEKGSILILTRDYNGHKDSCIKLNKDLTIDGQGHAINCMGAYGCSGFYSNTGNIVMKNIRIINGHYDKASSGGGALDINGLAQYNLENCIFENNWAHENGGAIYYDGKNLTVTNCIFKGNKVAYGKGGAIYSPTKNVVIDNCTFTNNEAKIKGGAIYTEGTVTVNGNHADREYNSFFNNNKANDQSAGAIYARYINLKNAEFKDNIAHYYGGAIYSFYETNATNCLFVSNKAENSDGGAIYILDPEKNSYFKGCIFKSNNAGEDGGAVCGYNGDVYIDNCTFENNHAGYKGGAVDAHAIYINTNQSENESYTTYFTGNTVANSGGNENNGGAVYATSDVY